MSLTHDCLGLSNGCSKPKCTAFLKPNPNVDPDPDNLDTNSHWLQVDERILLLGTPVQVPLSYLYLYCYPYCYPYPSFKPYPCFLPPRSALVSIIQQCFSCTTL